MKTTYNGKKLSELSDDELEEVELNVSKPTFEEFVDSRKTELTAIYAEERRRGWNRKESNQ